MVHVSVMFYLNLFEFWRHFSWFTVCNWHSGSSCQSHRSKITVTGWILRRDVLWAVC